MKKYSKWECEWKWMWIGEKVWEKMKRCEAHRNLFLVVAAGSTFTMGAARILCFASVSTACVIVKSESTVTHWPPTQIGEGNHGDCCRMNFHYFYLIIILIFLNVQLQQPSSIVHICIYILYMVLKSCTSCTWLYIYRHTHKHTHTHTHKQIDESRQKRK